MSTWRFTDDQGVERELPTSELRSALASGTLLPSTLVWRDGMKEWQPAFTLPELATAAIAAARGPRAGSMPPGPPPKRGPLKTLLGVEAPLVPASDPRGSPPAKPKTAAASITAAIVVPSANPEARTSPETQPITSATGGIELDTIPRAPKLPTAVSAAAAPTSTSSPASTSSPSAPLTNGGSRPRSVPPPLPGSVRQTNKLPRRLPTPAPFLTGGSQRRPTLMGFPKPPPPSEEDRTVTVTKSDLIDATRPGASVEVTSQVTRSKPPPPMPPKRSKPPEDETTRVDPAPGESAAKPRPKPPIPAKRSIPPGPAEAPQATPAPAPARIAPPKRSHTLQMPAIGEEPTTDNTTAKPVEKTPEKSPADKSLAAPVPVSEARPLPPKPVDPRKVPGESTDQIAPKLLGAKELLATLGDEEEADTSTLIRRDKHPDKHQSESDRPEGEPSSRRAKTLEMSLADHEDAAQADPVPKSEEPASKPPRSTDKLPPPSKTPNIEGGDTTEELASLSRIPRSRTRQAFEIPRRSILGASALWVVGLVMFFFVGRCSGIQRATEVEDARTGAGKALLLHALPEVGRSPVAMAASEPKPCWVSRQPARWAKEASKNVPFDSEASAGSMALGYAVSDKQGVGIVIDPKTGKFEEKLRRKTDTALARVSPMAPADGGFYLSTKGDKDIVAVNAEKPFYLVIDKASVGHSDTPDGSPTEIFHLDGDGDAVAPQVVETKPANGPESYFLTFRRGTSIFGGAFGDSFAPVGALATIPGSGGKTGKPKAGFNGTEVAVTFADMPEGGKWQVRLGHAKLGTVPDSTAVVDLPEGGPGGDRIAPDIVGLQDGRWILMWTEGSSGERAIRAITLSRDFQPIGDPIALSPPAGDFGQASLGVVGTYTTVVFLQRGDEAFEMWGAVLQCG